jgi:hypothetical protein
MILIVSLRGQSQVIPNVSIDTLMIKMFPIYREALKSGVYDLPLDTSWQNLKTYDTQPVSIKMPQNWLELGGLGNVVEASFDASGLYFPDQFENRPIMVGVFLLNQSGNSLEEVRDSALKDYRNNADRVFESEYKDSVYKYTLANGEHAYILHTRFFRKSNQLNQSRYDLVFFSNRYKKGYSLMISVQYHDPTYLFEKINYLEVFASRVFTNMSVK